MRYEVKVRNREGEQVFHMVLDEDIAPDVFIEILQECIEMRAQKLYDRMTPQERMIYDEGRPLITMNVERE